MNLTANQRDKVKLLVKQAISKAGDRPELIEELDDIISKLDVDEFSIQSSINEEDLTYVYEVIEKMEKIIEQYVKFIDVNNIEALETAKKELSVNLMYLSSYKDKFMYEIEYIEDVFKKEIFAKLTSEISLKEGISYTQAEKKVNADERYCVLRKQITELKTTMNTLKTKYDFFSKMIQVIVQSISVAGKEHYVNRVNN